MEVSNEDRRLQLPTSLNFANSFGVLVRRWPSSAGSRSSPRPGAAPNDPSNNICIAAQELFCEACSALYNDILDASDDHHSGVNESDILCRQMEIVKQGTELSNALPQLSSLITSKLSTVNRAMEHLKLNRRPSLETGAREEGEPTALSELRKWVQTTGEKLSAMEAKFTRNALARKELDRLAADQQILQLQIETEGHTLVKNVQRTVARYTEGGEATEECWIQRRERHLKTLTQRWYHLWIRSLSVQCRIERQLDQLYLSDEESELESDPELREPQIKRRRFNNNSSYDGPAEREEWNGSLRGEEEDTIPFAEEEYESIERNAMPQTLEDQARKDEGTVQRDESSMYSTAVSSGCEPDVSSAWSGSSNYFIEAEPQMTEMGSRDAEEIDEQRRQRIQCTPVKSFYKTVPLDETGATDTETPRVSMSGWPAGSLYTTDMNLLTDSLIVNTGEEAEVDSNENIKEILSMLEDDENGNPKWEGFAQQGTRWHEFKCGKTPYRIPFSHGWFLGSGLVNNDKHSCDASSEGSDDLPTDLNTITIAKGTTPPVTDPAHSTLKRRRKWRFSSSDRVPSSCSMMKTCSSALGQDMEASLCSQTCSEIAQLDGTTASLCSVRLPPSHSAGIVLRNKQHHVRRKLRTRRLPRSMSDGEHLGMWMNMSTHSAPGAALSLWSACRDSDLTAPEQSDAPPYEWDDYNPPAKAEDAWDEESQQQQQQQEEDISMLTIEDDFQMHLGGPHSIPAHLHPSCFAGKNGTPVGSERVWRPVAKVTGKCAAKHSNGSAKDKWKLEMAKTTATAARTTGSRRILNPAGIRYSSESDLGKKGTAASSESSTECSQSSSAAAAPCLLSSPLPAILSKIGKFASSLRLIQQEDDSNYSASLSTLSSIRSLGDVDSTLKIFADIHERLLEEQEELQSLLSSDSFSGDLSGLQQEFEPLRRGYEEAVGRVEQLMAQVEAIRDKWNDWAETQRIMQTMMRSIESDLCELRKGADNSQQICSELELCQERMNRLETVCNYLSCNLASLHHRSPTQPPIDFASELALYSNALIQLKSRFEQELGHAKSADKATLVRSRKRVHVKGEDVKKILVDGTTNTSNSNTNWSIKALFFIAVMAAFTAWFVTSSEVSWRTTIGPHLDYVNGPPPL